MLAVDESGKDGSVRESVDSIAGSTTHDGLVDDAVVADIGMVGARTDVTHGMAQFHLRRSAQQRWSLNKTNRPECRLIIAF